MRKIRLIWAVAAIVGCAIGGADSAKAQVPDWENPAVIERNKLAPRADFFGFESRELARIGDRTQSSRHLSLNGTWKFHYAPTPEERPIGFFREDVDVAGWDDIRTDRFFSRRR